MKCISYISKRYYLGIIYTNFPHFIVILQNNLIQIEYVCDGFEINVPDTVSLKKIPFWGSDARCRGWKTRYILCTAIILFNWPRSLSHSTQSPISPPATLTLLTASNRVCKRFVHLCKMRSQSIYFQWEGILLWIGVTRPSPDPPRSPSLTLSRTLDASMWVSDSRCCSFCTVKPEVDELFGWTSFSD